MRDEKINNIEEKDEYFESNRLTTKDMEDLKKMFEQIDPQKKLFDTTEMIINEKLKTEKNIKTR